MTRRPASRSAGALGGAAVAVLLGLWLSVAAFGPFTPALPQLGLDASWVAAMGEDADRGLRWGVDIAFTYGPASSLVTTYFNDAYLTLTLPLLLVTCMLFGACAAMLVPPGRAAARVGAAAALGSVAALSTGHPDSVFLVLPLLPMLLRLAPDRAGAASATVAGSAALAVGMIGMAKMSFPLAALPLFLLGDGAALLRRRAPVLTVACGLGFILGDRLYGQSPADLPTFLRAQGEVVAGYSEAMALDGGRGELAGFLSAAVALVVATAVAERSAPRRSGSPAAVPLGLAWALLILFKAGFVRQDAHTLIAWFGLALAAVVVAWARFGTRGAAAISLAAVAGAALLGLSIVGPTVPAAGRWAAAAAAVRRIFVDDPAAQIAAALDLARDPSAFGSARRDERAQRWRELAAEAPLPRLDGGVDVIPSRQTRVIAAGLDYRPRPSFQEYSTYTPGLIAANRAFLQGPRAPDWVLFGPETGYGSPTIDGRYPNLAEGGLWLDLLRLYRPERRIGDLVALRRRPVPSPWTLGEARRSEAGFDERVAVGPSSASARGVFASLDVRPTLLGRVAAFLFRPPPLTLSVDFADGHERSYRFLSGIGASGFVLSPLVENATEFEDLADGTPPPPGRVVTGFRVHASPRVRALLSPRIAVALEDIPAGDAAPRRPPATAWASLAAAAGLAPGAADVGTSPPSLLSVPVSGLPRLDLGFGLAMAEDAPPGAGKLCFAIRPSDGDAPPLWRRCLDRAVEADRAPQTVSVALPPGTAELALATTCDGDCDEGLGGYWAPH